MKYYIILALSLFLSCQQQNSKKDIALFNPTKLNIEIANQLIELPLHCIEQEYPNKLGQVIAGEEDLQTPIELHPTFYGCFDWHSAVHGHWSLIKLLKEFPAIDRAEDVRALLKKQLSLENISQEIVYFDKKYNKSFERSYGWAWLLKLSTELYTWDNPMAQELFNNLEPLSNLIAEKYMNYLPKLKYPIRVGTHTNTAFGLSFAYDYAVITNNEVFATLIKQRAIDFYINDVGCPISWEPSGYDFLSPCLEEIDIMRKVLSQEEFSIWIKDFMPEITKNSFTMTVGEVSDRTDGHLVHLDGVNFSRAWCFYGLANQYDDYKYLKIIANNHIEYSLTNLVGDDYEGGHWLASFAINSLTEIK